MKFYLKYNEQHDIYVRLWKFKDMGQPSIENSNTYDFDENFKKITYYYTLSKDDFQNFTILQ